jgi:hypothetical protein
MIQIHPVTGHRAINDASCLVEAYGYNDALAKVGMLKQSDTAGHEYWKEVESLIIYMRVQGGKV